ncbi:acyltransferase [soil metagenome]
MSESSIVRTSNTGSRASTIVSLEGLRGVAALLVALYHLHLLDKGPLDHGYLMVDLFFVLSGFIMFLSYSDRLRKPGDLRGFLIRRTGRLVPLYLATTLGTWVVLGAVALGWNLVNRTPDLSSGIYLPDAGDVVANLTLTHFLSAAQSRVIDWPSWSIGTEFYTYLLFAAVCVMLPRRWRLAGVATLTVTAAVLFVAMRVGADGCLASGKCLDAYRDAGFLRCAAGFFLGGLLHAAWLRLSASARAPAIRAWLEQLQWPVVVLVLVLITLVSSRPALAFAVPLGFAALIFVLLPDAGPVARRLAAPAVQALGRWSYSIYLVHAMLALVVEFVIKSVPLEHPAARLVMVALYLMALLPVSRWTYRTIEVPARDWFNRRASALDAGKARSTSRTAGRTAGQAAVTSGVAVNR